MFSQIFEREKKRTDELSRLTGINCPSDEIVKSALQKAEQSWKGLTEHDRFVPGGLGMPELFAGFYEFNSSRSDGGLKLYHEKNEERWRTDRDVEHLPTIVGVIRQDLDKMMVPTNLKGLPFNLDFEEQDAWAKEQGGDGIDSVEEALFLVLRKALELNIAPWGYGWCRCRNSGGQYNSLEVGWDAGSGLKVTRDDRKCQYSSCGALVRKFQAFVA